MVEVVAPETSHVAGPADIASGYSNASRLKEEDHTSAFAAWAAAVSMPAGHASDGVAQQSAPAYSNRWHCEFCGSAALPMTGARHHCRTCRRTVCDGCSMVPPRGDRGDRCCTDCSMRASNREELPREKYVFLVRHAQSTWNQNVDLVKTIGNGNFCTQDITLKDVVSRAAQLPYMARRVWHKDHPISEEGVLQTQELRCKIESMRQNGIEPCLDNELGEGPSAGGSSGSGSGLQRSERERRYYERFLTRRQQIYCSPLLRALQTAHLALPAEAGWGSIKLLKDARESFRMRIERDCVGARGIVGNQIIHRAMRMGQELGCGWMLPGLETRVDASNCSEQWWNDEPETEAELEARLKTLWRRLLEEDGDDSCVLVTHSNLIKALLMHFGSVDEDESEQAAMSFQSDYLCNNHNSDQCRKSSSTRSRGPPAVATSLKASFREAWRGLAADSAESHDAPMDLGAPEPGSDSEESCELGTSSWQVVAGSSDALRPLKTERLQNCGVLGLRCVLESPLQKPYPEVDGWVDLDDSHISAAEALHVAQPRWVALDALLMFDSVLVK